MISMQSPQDSTSLGTIASPPPQGYYVIIGRGTAAMVNHTTLRQTDWGKARMSIGEGTSKRVLPVMHIGFIDPWHHYHQHGMGQPPYLLGLPGYANRPRYDGTDALPPSGGLKSDVFGNNTAEEWNRLLAKYQTGCVYKQAWVPIIESRTVKAAADVVKKLQEAGLDDIEEKLKEPHPGNFPPYRVLTVSHTKGLGFVYAHKIDICNGPGEPNVPRHPAETNDYKAARTKPWMPFEQWDNTLKQRVIITGTEALYQGTFWNAGQRICVYGGGGIGLNMVERGEHEGLRLDWIARRSVHDGFNLRRNDTVLKHPSNHPTVDKRKKPMGPGESDCREPSGAIKLVGRKYKFSQLTKLNPKDIKWRFGALVTVDTMERHSGHRDKLNIVLAGSRGTKAAAKTTGVPLVKVNDTKGPFKVTAVTPGGGGVTKLTIELVQPMPDRTNPNLWVRNGSKLSDPRLYNGRPSKGDIITLEAASVGGTVLASEITFYDLHDKEIAKIQTRQPIGPGAKIGDFEVVSGKDDQDRALCPVPPAAAIGGTVSCGFGANDAGALKELKLKYTGAKPANVRVLNGSRPGSAELYRGRLAQGNEITIDTNGIAGNTLAADLAFQFLPDNADNTPVMRDAFEQEVGLDAQGHFPFSREYGEVNRSLTKGMFDRLMLCNGQNPNALGNVLSIAKNFRFDLIVGEARMVGVEADGGNIRILGSAAFVFANANLKDEPPFKRFMTYHESLPESAITPGMIMSAVNIAVANHYFDREPNNNANTAKHGALAEYIRKQDYFSAVGSQWNKQISDAVDCIVETRRVPENGFATKAILKRTLEQDSRLRNDVFPKMAEIREKILECLELDYRPADPFWEPTWD